MRARLLNIETVSPTVRKLTLKSEPGWTFQAGQFVIIPVPQRPEDAKPPKGFYSVASEPGRLPELELLVEHREGGGYVSGWVSALQPGAELDLDGPLGHFGLAEGGADELVFAGTRAGLAPLRAMLRASLADGTPARRWLFLGGEGPQDLLLDAEWKALAAADARFRYVPVLSPGPSLAEAIALAAPPRPGQRLYAAGFSRDLDPLKAQLLAAGYDAGAMKLEKFG